MEHSSLVSVVMATYNGAAFLRQQIASILEQDHRELELIICDDASVDETASIIREYAAADNRVSYFFQPVNVGVNKNFEKAFALAKAPFIAIADQDDVWKPGKISTMLPLFSSPDIILVHSASVVFSRELPVNKTVQSTSKPMTGNDSRRLLLRNSISGHNIIFRRSLLEYILPIPATLYYDWWLVVVATTVGNIAASNQVLAYQRLHGNNITIGHATGSKQTRTQYQERRLALVEFITIPTLHPSNKNFAQELLQHLLTLENKEYSAGYFRFLLKHAPVLFFYKKKLFPFLSYLKTARRMSYVVEG